MQKLLRDYLDELKKKQKRRRKAAIAALLVGIMLVSGVAWNLAQYGVAMTGEPKCGMQEHQHSEGCYQDVLICGQEEYAGHTHTKECYETQSQLVCGQEEGPDHTHSESCYKTEDVLICGQEESAGHTHTDACYERQLVCGQEEHIHSDICFIDTDADVEDASVWDAQYANTEWKNVWGEDLAQAAGMQIGYKESADNYSVAEDKSHKGYTRYGQFAEDVYADWDAAFVNFCMHYAGLEETKLFPKETETAKWYEKFAKGNAGENAAYLTDAADYEPQTGDIVFFEKENEETKNQMGIVSSYNKEKNEIKVIEGNCNNAVKENKYAANDMHIKAYLKITELETAYKNDGIAVSGEETPEEAEAPVAEELDYEDDQIIVKVIAAEKGIIPEGATLKVVPITKENAETEAQYQDVETKLQEKAESEEYDVAGFLAYDISFVDADGNKLEPNGKVNISMDYKSPELPKEVAEKEATDTEIKVLHLEEDEAGAVKQVVDMSAEEKATVNTLFTTEGEKVQSVEIETESFSVFTITWKNEYGLNVQVVDESGHDIGTDRTININSETNVEKLAPPVPGYEFKKATIKSVSGTEISALKRNKNNNKWKYTEKNEKDSEDVGNQQIYFIYRRLSSKGLIDLHGNSVSSAEYEQLAQAAEAAAGDTAQGRLPITWTRSTGVYNSSKKINTTWNWDTLMKSIGDSTLTITDPNKIWDGSRSSDGITSTHNFTDYLPNDKITVYKNGNEERKMYDSASWKLGDTDSYYRFRGEFDLSKIALEEGYTYADYDYTIESVLKELDNRIYINDNMYVFVYPTDVTLNNDNFTDYLAFWTGTSNKGGVVEFHDRQGTKATQATNKEGTFKEITDGWYTEPITDGAGGIIQNAINTKNSTKFYIDVIANDYAAGGAMYRLQIGATRQNKTEVDFYKVNSQNTDQGVKGARFTLTNNANPSAYRPIESDENGYVHVKVKPGTYTLKETAAGTGYEKTGNTWTVNVTEKGFTIELNGTSDGKAELGQYTTGGKNGKYYITNLATEPEPEPDPTPEKELTKTKTVIERKDNNNKADGTYDLELTVSGAMGNKTKKAQLDILLIIDKSSSMSGDKLPSAKSAAKNLVSTIQGNEGIDARYAVVSFSGNDTKNDSDSPGKSTKIDQLWTADAASAKNAIDSIALSKGTNYQAAFMTAEEVLSGARTNAEKVIIFLTDGEPYHWVDKEQYASGANNNGYAGGDSISNALEHAKEEIKDVYCDQFYAIAAYGANVNNLNTLNSLVGEHGKKPEKSGVYKAGTDTELNQVFKDIAANVTTVLCDHVTVTDTLSQYVEPVLGNAGSNAPITITVTKTVRNEDGTTKEEPVKTGTGSLVLSKTETNEEATLTASYDAETKQLTLNFPETYKLEPDYIYKVKMPIQPTEKAYSDYRTNNLAYPTDVKGDPETGTHAGKEGFYSNDSATVSYTYNGEPKTEDYDKPVVQIHPSTLVIEKTINGELSETDLQSLKEKLEFSLKLTNAKKENGDTFYNDKTLKLDASGLKYDEANKKYVYTLSGLSPDTGFEVNETNYDMNGYICTTIVNGQKGELKQNETFTLDGTKISGTTSSLYDVINTSANATNTISYVNEYANNSAKLDLKKVGTGNNFLEGAKFTLYKKAENGDWNTWKLEETSPESIVVNNGDTEAAIEYSGLLTGYYRLEEIEAPSGYRKLSGYIYFKVDKGVISLTDEEGNTFNPPADNKWSLTGPDNKVYELTIQNEVVYSLPSTGGPGIYWYIFGGVLLMAGAMLIMYKNKCKEVLRS